MISLLDLILRSLAARFLLCLIFDHKLQFFLLIMQRFTEWVGVDLFFRI